MGRAGESHGIRRWVHLSLLVGLVLSGLLMAGGLVLALVFDQPRPVGAPPATGTLLRRAIGGDGLALMDLGMLALMATPVLRVAVLTVGWCLERDWRFAAVAAVVLGLLGLSLALGVG
jgi:Protein of unknown function (DUF1634)